MDSGPTGVPGLAVPKHVVMGWIRTRERTCDNSYPPFGGVTCDGKPFEAQGCLFQVCLGTIAH